MVRRGREQDQETEGYGNWQYTVSRVCQSSYVLGFGGVGFAFRVEIR